MIITLTGGSLTGVLALAKNQGYTHIGWMTRINGIWTLGGLS